MYKVNLLVNTEADGGNGLLKTATVAVPLNYLSNFWRSLEVLLINCKIELKLKLTKYCLLSTAAADIINNRDYNNIIFTMKDTKLYVLEVTLSARGNEKLSKLLSKRTERSVY